MMLTCSSPFLLAAFGLYLGLSLDTVEAASCPGARINASGVCGSMERNDVKRSSNLTHLVCDKLQNLSQINHTFILQALEFGLRKNQEVPLNIARVLFSELDGEELEKALDEFSDLIENSSLISHPWKTAILMALWDERLRNEEHFNETAFVTAWFQKRLQPFLSAVSPAMLQCLQNETIQCPQYQAIVKGLDMEFTKMSRQTQEHVFHFFQLLYLKRLNSNGSACAVALNSSEWLVVNFGRFRQYAKYQDFVSLNSRFDGLDALRSLTAKQLGEMSATRGALKMPRDVRDLMGLIETSALTEYLDEFNRWVNGSLPRDIQGSLLEHVLVRLQETNDAQFIVWTGRLQNLIPAFNSTLVPRLFAHLEDRNCSAISAVTALLNGSLREFSNTTQQSIFEAILGVAANSFFQCYSVNSSFTGFLRETFQGFAVHLTLRDLRSLIRTGDLQKIVNTISPDVLADLLARDGFLNEDPFLTAVLQAYQRKEEFIDKFNQKSVFDILSNNTKAALLAGLWFTVVTSHNTTEVDLWFDNRLAHYLVFLDGDLLNTSQVWNASCLTFHKIVSKLSDDIAAFKGREEEIYYFIKAYLTAKTRPRCYNASSPDWLVMYLQTYIRYASARDIRLLTNYSAPMFQYLTIDPDNLGLLNQVTIRKDLAEMYTAALFALDPDFSLDSLPDQLICFARHSSRISSLTPVQALNLTWRVNLHCHPVNPSSSDRQLASMLVEQVSVFDGQTLVALGQQAVGLTTAQISNLTAQTLVDPKVLESLGRVRGWKRGQAQALMRKILHSNFMLDAPEKFERLGTLAQGLPSNVFSNVSGKVVIRLARNDSFVAALRRGPEYLKKAFVRQILSNASSLIDILNNVPDELVDQVPTLLLAFQGKMPDLRKINKKQWSPQQAAVFFGDVLYSIDNCTKLSRFILQGFQCGAASRLSPPQLESLAQEVKVKQAHLSEEQLSCMAKLLSRNNSGANFTSYPADVLLFFPLSRVHNQSCRTFYALASQGNLALLAGSRTHRSRLRDNAVDCFGVVNASLSKEQLRQLGAFVCDMDPATIRESDPGILENLKLCPDLTASQQSALNTRLSSGNTLYGAPAFWDEGTLKDLGLLAFYMNSTTWESVNKEERMFFFRNMAEGYSSQSPSQKEKILLFLKTVGSKMASSARSKRATESCLSDPITPSTLEDPLFIIQYDSSEQFDACLSNEVLEASLASLLEQPLPNDYLAVIKRKLDEIYPDGIPDDQLKLLSYLSRLYSAEEISKWQVISSDTLTALLNPDSGAWKPDQLKQLISTYMELGGELTGPLLSTLTGRNLCLLEADQLRQISPDSVRHAEKLDISSCSQDKKDILYERARAAFASQEGTSAYYPLIQPYLGGAPVEDLKKLPRSQVAMDINTFTNLNPEELKALSVQDVKDLLGVHLPDLKDAETHPSVATWIRSHFQSELDTLGIGLRGGMMPPTVSTAAGASGAMEPSSTLGAVTPIISSAGSTGSAGSITVLSEANTTTLPSLLTAAVDSPTAPLFKVTTADEISTPAETAKTTAPAVSVHPKAAVPTNVTASLDDTISRSADPTIATDISTMAAAHNMTANGTVFPTVARGINLTTAVNSTAAPSYITTNGTILPPVVTHIDVTASINTTATSSNITLNGTILPTTAMHIYVTSTTDSVNHTSHVRVTTVSVNGTTSTTLNETMTTSSERSPVPPIPQPNATSLSYLSTATASEALPATSTRSTVRSTETPHKTSLPPGPLHTTIAATPKRETTSTAPPKTHPTPNGYINVKPLSASASSLSLSCLLLTSALAVGLSALRRLF